MITEGEGGLRDNYLSSLAIQMHGVDCESGVQEKNIGPTLRLVRNNLAISHVEGTRHAVEHFLDLSSEKLARIGNYLVKNGHIVSGKEGGEIKKCLCCMDDRIPYLEGKVSLAGSGILVVLDMIKKGKNHTEIIDFLRPLFESNNIGAISSHQDCGAAKLFTAGIVQFLNIDLDQLSNDKDILEKIVFYLEDIFPGISEIDFQDEKIFVANYQDVIGALVLKYISQELNIDYSHIKVSHSRKIPEHTSRNVVVDLTDFNISQFFSKHNINPGYFIDASIFSHDAELLRVVCKEAVIAKMIALNYPGISQENKMKINIVYYDNCKDSQVISRYMSKLTHHIVTYEHPEFLGMFEIKLIPLKKEA